MQIGAEDNLSVVTRKFWEQLGHGYIYTEQRLFVYKVRTQRVFNDFLGQAYGITFDADGSVEPQSS